MSNSNNLDLFFIAEALGAIKNSLPVPPHVESEFNDPDLYEIWEKLSGLLLGEVPFGNDTHAGANRIVVSLPTAPAVLQDGFIFEVRILTSNTGGTTLAILQTTNPPGAENIVDTDGNVLTGGELKNGEIYLFSYNKTNNNYELLGLSKPGVVSPFIAGTGLESAMLKNTIFPNVASGDYSVAEGSSTIASGNNSHAEGEGTQANGLQSHAEGEGSQANGRDAHAEGNGTQANGNYSHSEGYSGTPGVSGIASGTYSHSEGADTIASGNASHSEGNTTIASGNNSHAEGLNTHAITDNAHAEGNGNIASGAESHAEGLNNTASGTASHAEGADGSTASGVVAHAEGDSTLASGSVSHAEGASTIASGGASHAEGTGTVAQGYCAHSEGLGTVASGDQSHSQNKFADAVGANSHAGGLGVNGGQEIIAGGAVSFNHSENTVAQVAGHGARGANSAILGGKDNDVDVASPRSVALGGNGNNIVGEPDTVQVQSFRVTDDFRITQGVNKNSGTSVAMVAGTIVIANTNVKAGAVILVSIETPGGVVGILSAQKANIVAGVSFQIDSSSALDTSTVNYLIINP